MEETKQIVIKDRPNSYEFGKPGNRFKLYFEDIEDLKAQIQELKDKGLYDEDTNNKKL